jgi:hypothetical protein
MIQLSELSDAAVGRTVVYRPTGERGTITSWNGSYIFVRYGQNPTGTATSPEDLDWEPGREDLLRSMEVAYYALRSYQYHNASPVPARECADHLAALLKLAGKPVLEVTKAQ